MTRSLSEGTRLCFVELALREVMGFERMVVPMALWPFMALKNTSLSIFELFLPQSFAKDPFLSFRASY